MNECMNPLIFILWFFYLPILLASFTFYIPHVILLILLFQKAKIYQIAMTAILALNVLSLISLIVVINVVDDFNIYDYFEIVETVLSPLVILTSLIRFRCFIKKRLALAMVFINLVCLYVVLYEVIPRWMSV